MRIHALCFVVGLAVIKCTSAQGAPLEPPPVLVREWLTLQDRQPTGLFLQGRSRCYLVDHISTGLVLNTSGGVLFGFYGSEPISNASGRLDDVTVTADGAIFATGESNDTPLPRLWRMAGDGQLIGFGGVNGENMLSCVAALDDTTVLVGGRGLIYACNKDGSVRGAWASVPIGELDIAVSQQGHVFVSDASSNRVMVFDLAGGALGGWGSTGSDEGQFSAPAGIAVDRDENVYVADFNNHRVQKFTADGQFRTEWGGVAIGDPLALEYPRAIAVDDDGLIYVGAIEPLLGGHRTLVKVFSPTAPTRTRPTSWGAVKARYR